MFDLFTVLSLASSRLENLALIHVMYTIQRVLPEQTILMVRFEGIAGYFEIECASNNIDYFYVIPGKMYKPTDQHGTIEGFTTALEEFAASYENFFSMREE